MRRFAAGEPFTNLPLLPLRGPRGRLAGAAFLRAGVRRAGLPRVILDFAATFFFRFFVVVRFFRSNACTAGVCCANPAKPLPGTNGVAIFKSSSVVCETVSAASRVCIRPDRRAGLEFLNRSELRHAPFSPASRCVTLISCEMPA